MIGKPGRFAFAGGLLILAALTMAAALPAPGLAADGAWRFIDTEYAPPTGPRPIAYDSRRDRMLTFADALYAFDFDIARWTRIETTGLSPASMTLNYDPEGDRLIAYRLGTLYELDLAAPGAWHPIPTAGPQPAARYLQASVYDPVGRRILLFGGADLTTFSLLGDAWSFDLATETWTLLAAQGTGPSPRRSVYAAYDPVGTRLLVFGGVEGSTYANLRRDLWALSLTGTPTWKLLKDEGPSPRMGGAACVDAGNHQMLIFGGDDGSLLNQLWSFDLSSKLWLPVSPLTAPSARTTVEGFFDSERSRFVIFAGYRSPSPNDVWSFPTSADPVDWVQLRPNATAFTARYEASVVWDPLRERAIVYGGNSGSSAVGQSWSMNSGESDWRLLPAAAHGLPVERSGATAIWDPVRDRMLVFGGAAGPGNGSTTYRDVLAMSGGDSPDWSAPTQVAGPSVRKYAAGAYDPVRDRVLYFAGYPLANARNQLWSLNLGGPTLTWTQLSPSGTGPTQRYGHTMTYDPSRDRMIVFGGGDGVYTNELFALSLSGAGQWTKLVGPGTPPPGRSFHSAIYDPIGDRLIVQGGIGPVSTYFADTWEYRFDGSGWREMDLTLDPAAATSIAVYDPHLHRMLMLNQLSGTGQSRDTWSLDLVGQTTDVPDAAPRSNLALQGAVPNPAFGAPRIAFTLPDGAPATIELLDLAGRRLRVRNVGTFGLGRHVVDLGSEGALAPGLYFARLTRGPEVRTAKVCIAR